MNEEAILEAIENLIKEARTHAFYMPDRLAKEILTAIRPLLPPSDLVKEPLEVNIKQSIGIHCHYFVCHGKKEFRLFRTKQEALDWCKQKGLRVVS